MNRVDEIESAEESEISYKENLQNQYLFAMPMSFLSGMGHGLCLISNSWWLKSLGFSYKNITLFILVNISFGLKFLWIPIFDKIDFTKFARRFFSLNAHTYLGIDANIFRQRFTHRSILRAISNLLGCLLCCLYYLWLFIDYILFARITFFFYISCYFFFSTCKHI